MRASMPQGRMMRDGNVFSEKIGRIDSHGGREVVSNKLELEEENFMLRLSSALNIELA
jgi:hypothetical protein